MLADRGFEVPVNNRRMAAMPDAYLHRSNLARIFAGMFEPQHRQNPVGMSADQVTMLLRTNLMEATLRYSPNRFQFDFVENQLRASMLRVREDSESGLYIGFLGDTLFRFKQSAKGNVTILEATDEDTFRFQAPTFAEFYRSHVDYCEFRLLPLLDHLGIGLPLSRHDSRVIQCVIAQLRTLSRHGSTDIAHLIEQLGSDEYSQREQAAMALRDGIGFYAPELRTALDKQLSMEARMRIQSLLRDAEMDSSKEVVLALALLDDIEYLKVILTRCSGADQPFVSARIKHLQSSQ
jgi:hypothetical protein